MSVIMARGRRYGLIAASLLSVTLLAACVGPAPSDSGEQRVDPDTAADIVADPRLELMLDYDDDLGFDFVTLLSAALDDGGLLLTTQFDADAYADAGNEPLQWLWNYDPDAEVQVYDATSAPEVADPSDVPGFRPWLRRYSAEGDLVWETPFIGAVTEAGVSLVPDNVQISMLSYAPFNVPGSDVVGLWSVSLTEGAKGLLKQYQWSVVGLADGGVLDSHSVIVPADADTGGVGLFVPVNGDLVMIDTVQDSSRLALVRRTPRDLEEPVWSVPLDVAYDHIRKVGSLIYLWSDDGAATLIDTADGAPVAGFERFDASQTFREVGGAIIRDIDRDGSRYLMRIDESGTERWDAEVEADRWGWASSELWVMSQGPEEDSVTDVRLIDLETGADVWAEPAGGPFGEVSGATDEFVVLADYVLEADQVSGRWSESLSVLDRATGELVVMHEIDWARKSLGDKQYYIQTVEGDERSVSAFRYGETDPVWTLDIGDGGLIRYARLLTVVGPDGTLSRITGTR